MGHKSTHPTKINNLVCCNPKRLRPHDIFSVNKGESGPELRKRFKLRRLTDV